MHWRWRLPEQRRDLLPQFPFLYYLIYLRALCPPSIYAHSAQLQFPSCNLIDRDVAVHRTAPAVTAPAARLPGTVPQ